MLISLLEFNYTANSINDWDRATTTLPQSDRVLPDRQGDDRHPTPRATARVPSPHQPYPRPYKDHHAIPRRPQGSLLPKATATPRHPQGDRKGPIPTSTLPPPLQRYVATHRILVSL